MGHPNRLPWSQRIFYGVGHCLNDLAATMWFSYLMVYLQLVLCFDANYTGFVMLVGQVADAIATPLLGYEVSQPSRSQFCKKYGKRKALHLIGTVMVIASLPFIFTVCPGLENSSEFGFTVMLVPIVIIFQIGWAAVQISHLSLIPAITPHETERDFLNVLRYAADVVSDIGVYAIVWAVFDLTRKPTGSYHTITKEYANKFMMIVMIIVGVGAFFSAIFHIGVKETSESRSSSVENSIDKEKQKTHIQPQPTNMENNLQEELTVSWKGWLKEVHFYQIGLLYMFARLFQNMSCMFMPLYLQESLKANDDFIAKIPLLMNLSGFAIAFALPKFFKVFSKRIILLAGAALGVSSCFWVAIGQGPGFISTGIYGVGIVMGAASSVLVVSTLSFIHDLIGTSSESGAFVYGCMSFCDKLANGIAGMIIQHMHTVSCNGCDWFYRDVLSYGVGSTAVITSLILIVSMSANLGKRQSTYNGAQLSPKQEVKIYETNEAFDEAKPLLEKKLANGTKFKYIDEGK